MKMVKMCEKAPKSEVDTQPSHELVHIGMFDVLIAPNIASPEQTDMVIFQVIRQIQELSDQTIYPLWFNVESSSGKLFIKRKTHSGMDNTVKSLRMDVDGLDGEVSVAELKKLRSRSSVINEMKSASLVEPVVETPEAQAIAHSHGFESLEYIRPLMTVIDKTSGYKFVAFHFCEMKERENDDTTIEAELIDLFSQHGIAANDLEPRHLQVGANNKTKLYLFDTEEYHLQTKSASRQRPLRLHSSSGTHGESRLLGRRLDRV